MDISKKLVSSCDDLFSSNIINEEQYIKCKTEIDDNGYSKKIRITENKIFNTNRNAREKKYNEFVNRVESLVKNIFKNIYKDGTIKGQNPPYNYPIGTNVDSELKVPISVWNEYYTILTLLNGVIIDIIENVTKKSLAKYKSKEKLQYKQLLEFYNKIDKNRKEINELNKKYGTLDKMKEIQKSKLSGIKNSNSSTFSILIIMYILTFLFLIILILVIKYK
jgi:hypothetical protein